MDRTKNALTIDVEDFFQAFEMRKIKVDDAKRAYLDKGTEIILAILKRQNIKTTFFINGTFAEKNKNLVKKIDENGHEIGIHSYSHRKINELSLSEFSEELRKAKEIIERIINKEILGFRAPAFSFDEKDPEYTKILIDHGFLYDSSTYPISKAFHGHPGYNHSFHRVSYEEKSLMEFPLATFPIMGQRLPWAGGLYLRILPYSVFKWGLRHINKTSGPAVLYIHNWELDPEQPKIYCKPGLSFIHYYGLASVEKKFERLTKDFRFVPLKDFLYHR